MRQRPAIEIALDLKAMPSLIKTIRKRPLPPEVTPVIRVAAGASELIQEFSTRYGCSDIQVREACIFFLQQALLFSGADSHRMLGVSPGASLEQIRTHRRWLLMWLHPDRNKDKWESALFDRVQSAAKALGDPLSSVAAEPSRKPVRHPFRRKHKGRKTLHPVKRPRGTSRIVANTKSLAVLILAAAALFLSIATIVKVLGAEPRSSPTHETGSAALGWNIECRSPYLQCP